MKNPDIYKIYKLKAGFFQNRLLIYGSTKWRAIFHSTPNTVSDYALMLGSSSPRPFFLSTAFRTKPKIRAATPRQANITNGAV